MSQHRSPRSAFVLSFLVCLSYGFCLSMAAPVRAAVVYVNHNAPGTTHDGASWGSAYLTMQAGVDAAQLGDEVWVAKGTYLEHVKLAASSLALYGGFAGTETARSQRDPRIHVTSLIWNSFEPAIDCSGIDLAVFSGFRIRVPGVGILADSLSSGFVTISDCDIAGGSHGVFVHGARLNLRRNVIGGGEQAVRSKVDALTMVGNTLSASGYGALIELGTTTCTAEVTGNTITGNIYGLSLPGARYATVSNNIVAFNIRTGIAGHSFARLHLSANDVFGNGGGNYDGIPDATGRNGNLSVDPKLSSIYRDITIQPDSPCRDAGDDSAAASAQDVAGQPRIQGAATDIGSDESDGLSHAVTPRRWYVKTNGNDTAPGDSWANAKATLAAVLQVAQGGDEAWVAAGTYSGNIFLPAGFALYGGFAGNETDPSQRNIAANETILKSASTNSYAVACRVADTRVDGFTIRDGLVGVHITGHAHIANCSIIANSAGVVAFGGSATLVDNFIADARTDGVTLYGSNVTMTGNIVDWHSKNGITVESGSYLKLTRNHVQRANQTGLYVVGSARVDADNNVFTYNNLAAIWADTGSEVNLRNNSVAKGLGGVGVNVYAATARLTNNVIAFHPGFGVRMDGPGVVLTMDRNDVFGNNPDYVFIPPDVQAGNLSVDPLFVDFADWNFRLQTGSPLIDSGLDSAVLPGDLDRDGKPRILGAHVDLGAYEYGSAGFTLTDVLAGLRITGGLLVATPSDLSRLDVADPAAPGITLPDAAQLARKIAGLEANP